MEPTPKKENQVVDYKNKPDTYYKKNLSPEAYKVCREQGTEKAFSGKYDKFYEKGTYTCACCGGDYPIYNSKAKFDSKTGWPSFWEPIDPSHIELVQDNSLIHQFLGARTEVRCARCGSHLGHVFDDGPPPTGKRYCMNSVALHFVAEGQTPTRTFSAE
ncbi:MAG: peptide-methionine (R)-S-oxide reductase MsrB [Alphaproteobacteria bacterium]|nr:peptide-methionine (R)-S-oxide reductase MsrB [Alphaproteobacteria bacterium]